MNKEEKIQYLMFLTNEREAFCWAALERNYLNTEVAYKDITGRSPVGKIAKIRYLCRNVDISLREAKVSLEKNNDDIELTYTQLKPSNLRERVAILEAQVKALLAERQ